MGFFFSMNGKEKVKDEIVNSVVCKAGMASNRETLSVFTLITTTIITAFVIIFVHFVQCFYFLLFHLIL